MNQPTLHYIPNPAVAPIRDGEHYRHLLGRTKWYLIISSLTVIIATVIVVFLVVRPENPELTAQALIGLENTTDISGAKEAVKANLGREDIMMSRTFLRDVVRKLSLQLWTIPYSRDEIVTSVSIDSSAACGTYCVRVSPGKGSEFMIYYYDTTAISLPLIGFLPGKNFKIIASGKWKSELPIHLPGMSLQFSRSLRERPRAVSFRVVDIRVAVEAVYRNLTIKRADPDKGINYISVLMTGRDYALAATTANAIADAFIEKNVSFSQSRDRSLVASLEKQLGLSQGNLAAAESKIRDFQSRYPQVGLNQQTQQTVSSLAQLDNGIQNMSAAIANGATLRNEYMKADSSQRLQIAGEIAEMLSAQSIPAGKLLSENLNQLLAQRQEMIDKYGTEHPLRLENDRSIQRVSRSILAALDVFIGSAQSAISNKRKNVQQLSGKLRQLPAQEMQLGELRRNQQIFADIYSAVLSRYNQAKVADAVQTAAFYIMDYAVAPLPPPADPGRLLVYGILIALLASFGPVFIYNHFDKSVRSQRQLARITSHVVLEAIPLFYQTDEKNQSHKQGYHPLIQFPCNPNFTREIFDSLLVKIKLLQAESADHSIVVSSFEGGCGKSTISANLAIAIAMRGHRTLLVDGDLRRGMVKDIFNLPDSGGLAALLAGQKPLTEDDCIRSMVPTKIPGLYVIPSGKEPPNPGLLLSSPRMEEFRQHCKKLVAYSVIDTPPLGIVSDAVVIQKFFSHYIFVVRSGKTNVAELVTRINEFDQLSEKILGYVLNGASHNAVGTYRRYSKYYTK